MKAASGQNKPLVSSCTAQLLVRVLVLVGTHRSPEGEGGPWPA